MSDSSKYESPEIPANVTGLASDSGSGDPSVQLGGFQLWLSKNRESVLRLGLIAFVLGFIVVGVTLWLTDSLNPENIGYGGLWVVSFIAAGSVILPIPGPAAVCITAAPDLGLTPLYIGIVSGSAEALGEMTGYMAGLSGRSFLERRRYYSRFHSLLVIPNPFFDVLGIAAGSIGYPVKRFLGVVFIAKSIKSTGIAYLCFLGIDSFVRWLG